MPDLKTTYMGIPLRSPIVVGASSVSGMLDRIKMAEQAGAGGLVIRSLFEEQIQFDALRMEESLAVGSESTPEARSYFPAIKHGDADEHLMWVEKTRKAVSFPLFASLNAVSRGAWTKYARQLEGTGVNGLELNVYVVAADARRSGTAIEVELFDVVEAVRQEVKIPLAIKISPFYTSVAYIASELDKRGASSVVLFNRFLQPDIDPATESLTTDMVLERSGGAQAAAALDGAALRPHQGRDRLEHRRALRAGRRQGAAGRRHRRADRLGRDQERRALRLDHAAPARRMDGPRRATPRWPTSAANSARSRLPIHSPSSAPSTCGCCSRRSSLPPPAILKAAPDREPPWHHPGLKADFRSLCGTSEVGLPLDSACLDEV